jgi:hypothetical protein
MGEEPLQVIVRGFLGIVGSSDWLSGGDRWSRFSPLVKLLTNLARRLRDLISDSLELANKDMLMMR